MNYSPNKKLLIYFFVIATLNLIVFWPSFFHVARADQIVYLIEQANYKDAVPLLSHSLSFPRTRLIYVGDQILYRPLLFTFMALQKLFFGYHFVYWQVTGFLLHLLVLWQLLHFLNKIRTSIFTAALVMNFSVLYIGQEMVIWHGISGYLLALNFVLAALNCMLTYIQSKGKNEKVIKMLAIFLFLACFTFEYAILFSLSIAVAMAWYRWRFLKLSLASTINFTGKVIWPVGFYIAMSVLDYSVHPGFANHGPSLAGQLPQIAEYLHRFMLTLMIITCSVFFPQFTKISPLERSQLTSFKISEISKNFGHYNLQEFVNVLILILSAFLAICIIVKIFKLYLRDKREALIFEKTLEEKSVLLFFCKLSVFFALLYIVSIIATRDIDYLSSGLYHFYIIFIFLTIAAYCVFLLIKDFFYSKLTKILLITTILFSIFLNGAQCYSYNLEFRSASEPWRVFLLKVDDFVNKHKQERDFSFDIVYSQASHQIAVTYGSADTGVNKQASDYEFLFKPYVQIENPKYYLIYTKASGLLVFSNRLDAENFRLQSTKSP